MEARGKVRVRAHSEASTEAYDRGIEPAASGEVRYPLGRRA